MKKELLDSVSTIGVELVRDEAAVTHIKLCTSKMITKQMFANGEEPPQSDHLAPDEWSVNNRTPLVLGVARDAEFTRCRDRDPVGKELDVMLLHQQQAAETFEKQNYPTAPEAANFRKKKAAQVSYDQAVQARPRSSLAPRLVSQLLARYWATAQARRRLGGSWPAT
eukprot:7079568-Pyramimonas_sp.AAC.1